MQKKCRFNFTRFISETSSVFWIRISILNIFISPWLFLPIIGYNYTDNKRTRYFRPNSMQMHITAFFLNSILQQRVLFQVVSFCVRGWRGLDSLFSNPHLVYLINCFFSFTFISFTLFIMATIALPTPATPPDTGMKPSDDCLALIQSAARDSGGMDGCHIQTREFLWTSKRIWNFQEYSSLGSIS